MTSKSLREDIRSPGTTISPPMIAECMAIYARFLPDPATSVSRIERDIAYGPNQRHRLDIFTGADGGDRPVLVYVHGGGFVGGEPNTPFYVDIGASAARQGFVGVTMTYRLAPTHPWPAGAEDVELWRSPGCGRTSRTMAARLAHFRIGSVGGRDACRELHRDE